MIPETSVNWKAFEYKYSDNPQRAFENLTYYLFCHEFHQKNGIFRYFNQPHIETNPIQVGDKLIGFQSKYYADSVAMSGKKDELIKAVEGAARSYPGITTLYFYISREFSPSLKKGAVEPLYKVDIERAAQNLGIMIVWRGISNIEAQLMQNSQLTICRNVFFRPDSSVQKCCESLNKHKNDIFENISSNIKYKGSMIVLDHNVLNIEDFINSDNHILIVDGDAGSGKSALIKQTMTNLGDQAAFLAFKSTDMDVDDKLRFLALHGMLTIDEVIDVYKEADIRILYIDAAEKYFVLENQDTFRDILQVFIKAGWKLVLTIRTVYKASFYNCLLKNVKVQQYHIEPISNSKLLELSGTYGFVLPSDKKLKEFLCTPFYLNLYLALENVEDEEKNALNREVFEEKIWEDIIRNNRKRKNNMPARREEVLLYITMEMLMNDNYMYEIQSSDDYQAFTELEQAGILNQTNDVRKYYHSHDVFEELAVNHIFLQQYKKNIEANQFFAPFRPSLRVRKLFRSWLADFAGIKEHQDIVFKILDDKDVSRIWKDDVLLTVVSTEKLKDVFCGIALKMSENNYEMLKKIALLINTCCRVAEHAEVYFNRGNLMPFRFSKPSGYAWKALFVYIFDNKESINWDKELILVVTEILDSWTMHYENIKKENTRLAGKIGLFLLEQLSDDKDLRYTVRDKQINKLLGVLFNSAWMIKEELISIFQIVLDGIKGEDVLSAVKNGNPNVLRMYSDLAKRSVSDIYHCGQVPFAMLEMTMRLMESMWISQDEEPVYHSAEMDSYFGLNIHLSNEYYPVSAYKTPIINMLQVSQKSVTDFIIDFCNKTGEAYLQSQLNKDYEECTKVMIYVNGQEVEQTASDRLWKMYRGTHVGPNLLVSLLMGFEAWLLKVTKDSETSTVIDFCRYVLIKSKNVMLTAVIVSIAEAYPEKMVDIVCDLLKTKEIFHFDSDRFVSEGTALFLLHGDNLYEEERRESNKLPHRRKKLEDIILKYQTDKKGISEKEFSLRFQKIYSAIDAATEDIDTWQTSDKYAYYRMDLRHYNKLVHVEPDGEGNNICLVMPDFTEDMEKLSKKSRETSDSHFRYMDLQLWSNYKYNENEKFKEYDKYSDITVVSKELEELWEFLCNHDGKDIEEFSYQSSLLHRYRSIVPYTCTVLLRDFDKDLSDSDRDLCTHIIFELGYLFSQISDFEYRQANAIEALTHGLILLLNEENRKTVNNGNPLYLLLKLVLRDWGHDSCVIKQIANAIWKQSESDGWKLVYMFSLLADQYEVQTMKQRNLSVDDFLESHQQNIEQILMDDSISVDNIDFKKLSGAVTFAITSFVSVKMNEAFIIAELTKDTTIRATFGSNYNMQEERRNLLGYSLDFIVWFADVLLNCDRTERKILIEAFMDRADINRNEHVQDLLKWLIIDQETYGKIDEFWDVWELLKSKMIEFGNEEEYGYYTSCNMPFGKDRVITTYLFANSAWRKNVHRCDLLSEDREIFFSDFIERSKNLKAMFYALAKLLDTVGKEPYKEFGMEWVYKLIMKDPECRVTFYDNTLFYLEEYTASFVARHRMEFRDNIELLQKVQTVLEYLVGQGSQIAFFVREGI